MAMADIKANPVPIAVIGAGRWGAHLVRIFLGHPGATLVAVAEGDRDRWDELAARFADHPAWGAVRYVPDGFGALAIADLGAVAIADLGAVAIATPASGHYDLVTAALERGLHVFVEKPLTLDGDQCDRLGTLAQRQGRHLFVDHTYLFHPAVEAGAAWLRSPDPEASLGRLHYGYGARVHLGPIRQDVDVLWDLAIHDIAIFNHWLNDTPIAVRAWGQTWLQPGHGTANQGKSSPDRPDPAAGLADLTWVQLRYGGGVTATVHLCWNNPDKQRRLALSGDRGTLIFDELDTSAPLRLRQGTLEQRDGRFLPGNEGDRVIPIAPGQSLSRACDRFLADLHREAPDPRANAHTAATLVRILAATSRSLSQDGQIQPIA
ncbi:MAG: Gfo/Idh/MocA family oxidoreductase [Cyanophyceae cyanobacterium]